MEICQLFMRCLALEGLMIIILIRLTSLTSSLDEETDVSSLYCIFYPMMIIIIIAVIKFSLFLIVDLKRASSFRGIS